MPQQPYKRKKFTMSSAHALPATWVVSSRSNEVQGQQRTGSLNTAASRPNEVQGQESTESLSISVSRPNEVQGQQTTDPNIAASLPMEAQGEQEPEGPSPAVPTVASSQSMTDNQPNIQAHCSAPSPQVAGTLASGGITPPAQDPNTQLQLVCPVLDPQTQHLMDMSFRQGFLQLDKQSMPDAPNYTQDIPQICINKIRLLLQDFNASLGTTRKLVSDTFHAFASPPGQQSASPTANLAHQAVYQDFRLCALVFNILHDTQAALTKHCANPFSRLCRSLLLRYASTFITAEYILAWYHVFRTDGMDRFDVQLYLDRMTKLLCARLALESALFQRRRWVEVYPPHGPGKEPEMKAVAGWDLCMAASLDLVKLLAEYSFYGGTHYTPAYLVSLIEAGSPASELVKKWSFRGAQAAM